MASTGSKNCESGGHVSYHTILGAGGIVGNGIASALVSEGKLVRLVSRTGFAMDGAVSSKADISNASQAAEVVKDSAVVYLSAGLKYDHRIWAELWPRIMSNTIEACKQANAKLVFFDNVYAYRKVSGPMTESTQYNPCSKKGEIRAKVATQLSDEMKGGNISAMIVRSADFYGPGADKTGVPNILVFQSLAGGRKPSCLVTDGAKHSYTYTTDIGQAVAALAGSDDAYGEVWHLPTAPNPFTAREFIIQAAREFGVEGRYRVLSKGMIRLMGLFDRTIAELFEMAYQNEFEYIFDSSKFQNAFGIRPTPYTVGIRNTVEYYRKK